MEWEKRGTIYTKTNRTTPEKKGALGKSRGYSISMSRTQSKTFISIPIETRETIETIEKYSKTDSSHDIRAHNDRSALGFRLKQGIYELKSALITSVAIFKKILLLTINLSSLYD